jgi:hypothetical protein
MRPLTRVAGGFDGRRRGRRIHRVFCRKCRESDMTVFNDVLIAESQVYIHVIGAVQSIMTFYVNGEGEPFGLFVDCMVIIVIVIIIIMIIVIVRCTVVIGALFGVGLG